jgi:hypothetical protein
MLPYGKHPTWDQGEGKETEVSEGVRLLRVLVQKHSPETPEKKIHPQLIICI